MHDPSYEIVTSEQGLALRKIVYHMKRCNSNLRVFWSTMQHWLQRARRGACRRVWGLAGPAQAQGLNAGCVQRRGVASGVRWPGSRPLAVPKTAGVRQLTCCQGFGRRSAAQPPSDADLRQAALGRRGRHPRVSARGRGPRRAAKPGRCRAGGPPPPGGRAPNPSWRGLSAPETGRPCPGSGSRRACRWSRAPTARAGWTWPGSPGCPAWDRGPRRESAR